MPDTMTRLRAHTTGTKYEGEIINTLLWMKNSGLAENTIETASHKLNQIGRHADLMNPEEVKTYIANTTVCNGTKQKLADIYNYFCKTHAITWQRPNYKYERKIPLIPTTENINKVISASSRKYATIFRILEETGIEGRELATTQRSHIDADQGIINVQGCKGHNSRSIKLKPETADMLRTYLHTYTSEKPFPDSLMMGEMWRNIRNRLADKLNEPQLRAIPLRNLRHHYATMLYDKTKDIVLVMQKLGHKKINTTMFYTQLVTITEGDEYTVKTATNIKEATDLLEHGFTYIQDIDNIKLYRKRK
jgi:integrase